MRYLKILFRSLTKENPTFGMILGLCPTLAISTSLNNALGMSVAVLFVLVFSNTIISSLRRFIPSQIRLPAYIVIIATFVTICELVMKAYFPVLDKALGIYIPLIVVNCIILGRAEAFASKNSIWDSFFDGLGSGLGFGSALCLIAFIREILGTATFLGKPIFLRFEPLRVFILPSGALFTMGILLGVINLIKNKKNPSIGQK